MSRFLLIPAVLGMISVATATVASGAPAEPDTDTVSPIYGVSIPENYRQWHLIAPASEAEPIDELRVVLGNKTAVDAYHAGKLPFPDGTILVKLAWKRRQSPEFGPATIPGEPTTVQVMVKNSTKYAASGGWGFGKFIGGKPADEAQHKTCFACHEARVQGHDYVFTRYAP
ncbi:cytochrome P460 family protein [Acetobacter estunensis]|uniref:cytochrome P460 family protein n=1 Tax=Acetobacter estunensis TaxID=104097 RepID=UPI001C2D57B8|nr:cytochrome P460 family protein [Acetobacter estunensis]MBV1838605.1 cytochrome P460 family protein [Acetobacter estunensis]